MAKLQNPDACFSASHNFWHVSEIRSHPTLSWQLSRVPRNAFGGEDAGRGPLVDNYGRFREKMCDGLILTVYVVRPRDMCRLSPF